VYTGNIKGPSATVDSALSSSSTNSVQNKVLYAALDNKLSTDGDSQNNTVTFTSNDSTSASAWTDVTVLTSKEKHSSIISKVSTMFKNIRYLYNNVGKIKGIIESLDDCVATTEDGYAASAKALNELNSKLQNKYVNLFSGTADSGKTVSLSQNLDNLEWKRLIFTLRKSSSNALTFAVMENLAYGIDTNLFMPTVYDAVPGYVHTIPSKQIKNSSATIEFDDSHQLIDINAELY
jgi:hypothetical protein